MVQHPITANGKNYRVDFALPRDKIAFEMDGYTYHGKERKHFNRDRRRDINLKLAGWEVHRFDGDLIRENPYKVVVCAAQLVAIRRSKSQRWINSDLYRRLPSWQRENLKQSVYAKFLFVACSYCSAAAGEYCRTSDGAWAGPHAQRIQASITPRDPEEVALDLLRAELATERHE